MAGKGPNNLEQNRHNDSQKIEEKSDNTPEKVDKIRRTVFPSTPPPSPPSSGRSSPQTRKKKYPNTEPPVPPLTEVVATLSPPTETPAPLPPHSAVYSSAESLLDKAIAQWAKGEDVDVSHLTTNGENQDFAQFIKEEWQKDPKTEGRAKVIDKLNELYQASNDKDAYAKIVLDRMSELIKSDPGFEQFNDITATKYVSTNKTTVAFDALKETLKKDGNESCLNNILQVQREFSQNVKNESAENIKKFVQSWLKNDATNWPKNKESDSPAINQKSIALSMPKICKSDQLMSVLKETYADLAPTEKATFLKTSAHALSEYINVHRSTKISERINDFINNTLKGDESISQEAKDEFQKTIGASIAAIDARNDKIHQAADTFSNSEALDLNEFITKKLHAIGPESKRSKRVAADFAQDLCNQGKLDLMSITTDEILYADKISAERTPNVKKTTVAFDNLTSLVQTDILSARSQSEAVNVAKFYMEVLKNSLAIKDYNSVNAIRCAFDVVPIQRIVGDQFSKEEKKILQEAQRLCDPTGQLKAMKADIANQPVEQVVVPYLGAYTSDATMAAQNPMFHENDVNARVIGLNEKAISPILNIINKIADNSENIAAQKTNFNTMLAKPLLDDIYGAAANFSPKKAIVLDTKDLASFCASFPVDKNNNIQFPKIEKYSIAVGEEVYMGLEANNKILSILNEKVKEQKVAESQNNMSVVNLTKAVINHAMVNKMNTKTVISLSSDLAKKIPELASELPELKSKSSSSSTIKMESVSAPATPKGFRERISSFFDRGKRSSSGSFKEEKRPVTAPAALETKPFTEPKIREKGKTRDRSVYNTAEPPLPSDMIRKLNTLVGEASSSSSTDVQLSSSLNNNDSQQNKNASSASAESPQILNFSNGHKKTEPKKAADEQKQDKSEEKKPEERTSPRNK